MIQAYIVVLASHKRAVEWRIVQVVVTNLVTAMHLPCLRRGHRLTTEDIVLRRVVQCVESLLFTPALQWDSRHGQCRDEIGQQLALGAIA